MQHPNTNIPRPDYTPTPTDANGLSDVYVTVGDPVLETVYDMLDDIALAVHASSSSSLTSNTRAVGRGRWEDYTEHSGFLLYTGVPYADALQVKAAAIAAGRSHRQDAVGVSIIPHLSALIPTNQ